MSLSDAPMDPALHARIADFLYQENALLDERRYSDWVELFTPDAVYWVPANEDATDPLQHVSLIYDDVRRIRERIARAGSGMFWAQDPPTRTTRLLGNIRVRSTTDETYAVQAKLVLVAVRRGQSETLSGTCRYTLVPGNDGYRIRRKEVLLAQNDAPQINLTFLL